MTEYAAGLYEFFSSFDIPAYEENTVSDDATLPYITYSVSQPDWRDSASVSASLWFKDTSFEDIFKKTDEISKKIGEGLRIPVNGGCLWIYKEAPFAQLTSTSNDNIKMVALNIGVNSLVE